MRRAAQIVVDRLVAANRPRLQEQVLALAVIPIGRTDPVMEVASALASRLGTDEGSTVVGESDAPELSKRARWAHHLETANRYVVYGGTPAETRGPPGAWVTATIWYW